MSDDAGPTTKIVSVPAVDGILERYIARFECGLSGVAAMAVNRAGGIVYSGAFGRRSLDVSEQGPMRLDTVGWIGKSLFYPVFE